MTARRLIVIQPIVEPDGTMSAEFRQWATIVSNQMSITGDGSPEGVVEAPQFSEYIDKSGATGSLVYKKIQPDIAGDKKQGWVLV